MFVVAYPIALALAMLSWRLVERPALAHKPVRRLPFADLPPPLADPELVH